MPEMGNNVNEYSWVYDTVENMTANETVLNVELMKFGAVLNIIAVNIHF